MKWYALEGSDLLKAQVMGVKKYCLKVGGDQDECMRTGRIDGLIDLSHEKGEEDLMEGLRK